MSRGFVDREDELKFLEQAWERPQAQLLVMYGRRRVGKTALLQRFASRVPAVHHIATRLPERQQLAEIGRALGRTVEDPVLASGGFQAWEQLFLFLQHAPRRIALILDEYPYLVEANRALSSLWQRAWDERLAAGRTFVVLSGSSIAMMEQETLDVRSPLYGRRTGQLRLLPLAFRHISGFLPRYSFQDLVRTYAVVGGVPYYLRLFEPARSLLANIRRTVLEPGAPLREEVEFLLRQELREPRIYFAILSAIAAGKRKLAEILNSTGLTPATAGKYLAVLQDLGLVAREVPVTERRPEKSKRGLYRIRDQFVRFWFRFVLSQQYLLETGRTGSALETVRKELDHFASETYETICLEAVRAGLLDGASGAGWEIVGRWWDSHAEIDILGMDAGRSRLLAAEVKWSARPVGTNVLADLHRKVAALGEARPGTTMLALFSRSGFTPALLRTAAARPDLHLVHGLDLLPRRDRA